MTAAVLALGALASAITAIVGLWPDPDVLDRVEIISVETSPQVRLSDYEREQAPAGFQEPATNGLPRLVQVARTESSESASPSPTPSPDLDRRLSHRDLLDELSSLAPEYVLPTDDDPEALVMAHLLSEDPEDAAKRLAGILHETRVVRQSNGKLDPLVVVVTANLRVDGLAGRKLGVFWRITGEGENQKPYSRWMADARASSITAGKYNDGGSVEFWVPMPKEPGHYKVQVIVKKGAARLATRSSDEFD